MPPATERVAAFIGGFVAAEGTFVRPTTHPRFTFVVGAFAIQGLRDHLRVTIPFMDLHLPVSYKWEQYLKWRGLLLDSWEHDAKRVRPCTVEGCEQPRRAHGLCRHHLFAARGV